MIAFLLGGGRRLALGAVWWIFAACLALRGEESPAPLRLEAEVKGRWLRVVGSKAEALLVEQDGRITPVESSSPVRLSGDLASRLDQVRCPTGLGISEKARPTASRESRTWSATVKAGGYTVPPKEPTAKGVPSTGWALDDSARALAACVWLVDGRVTQLKVRETVETPRGASPATFELAEAELPGTAAWVAFVDGNAVPVVPAFAADEANKVSALLALGRDAEAAAIVGGWSAVPEPMVGSTTIVTTAARTGSVRTLEGLLRLKVSLEPKSETAPRALDVAIAAGRLAVVERLLAAKCSTRARAEGVDTPLHDAVESGNLAICRALVAAKARTDVEGRRGITPLIAALNSDRVEIAHWLLGLREAFPPTDDQSSRVLITKASHGQLELVKLYREHGANPDFEWDGHTALQEAAREGHADVVAYLIAQGASVDRASKGGVTALQIAAERGRADVVALLLAAKADPNRRTVRGVTPLLGACFCGSGPTVKRLLASGADLGAVGPGNITSLRLALSAGAPEAVAVLLAHGAKVDVSAPDFDEQLQAALAMDSVEFVARALAAGLTPEHRLAGDWPVVQVARMMSAEGSLQLLGAAVRTAAEAEVNERFIPAAQVDVAPKLKRLEVARDPRDAEEIGRRNETVVVEAVIDENGAARFARATCPDCRLSRAATEAVRASVFAPATRNGKPISTRIRVPIRFVDRRELAFAPSEVDVMPKNLKLVPPVYPLALKQKGVQGRVVLEFVVTPDGLIRDLHVVSSSDPGFEEPALTALNQWRFAPGVKDGAAVAVRMRAPLSFMLD